jgi:hydroxymethylpyrimidine/phosphomethylpyrimidine kinase
MVAKSGDALLRRSARTALCKRILPLALVVTPNIPEAEVIAETSIRSQEDIREAARRILDLGSTYVLIKGGHLEADDAVDYLFDGAEFWEFAAPRIDTKNTHGTGCTYSAAIAAFLARGAAVPEAVEQAKTYLTTAIEQSFNLGKGHGPLNHFWPTGRP